MSKLTFTATVSVDEMIKKLEPLINNVSELRDLVPSWNNIEADRLEQRIYEDLKDCIKINK